MSGVFVKESGDLTKIAGDEEAGLLALSSRVSSLESLVESLDDASQKSIYIDYVNGDDNNDGLSEVSPIKTFPTTEFLDRFGICEYFQFIFMSNYEGNITVPRKGNLVLFKSIDANSRITITGQTVIAYIPSVILQDINFAYATADQTVKLQHCDALVKDCDFTNTSGTGASARHTIGLETVSNSEFRNCNVTGRRCIVMNWSNAYIRKQSGKSSTWTATLDYIASVQAGTIFTDDSYLPCTFVAPTGFMARANAYATGVRYTSGKREMVTPISVKGVSKTTVEDTLNALNNAVTSRNVIFIGDSYGTLYRNNTTTIPEQLEPLLTARGITMYHRYVSGAGFCNGGYLTNLQYLASSITDKNAIDEIWVMGGWNDEITRNDQTVEDLQTAMTAFATYAKTNYPNAKLSLSFYSFGFDVVTDTTHSQQGYNLNDLGKTFKTYYGYAVQAGFCYVKGLEPVFHNLSLMEPNDGVTNGGHPNDNGIKEVARHITNILLTGDTFIAYSNSASRYWGDNTNCVLATGITSTSVAKWYMMESICNDMFRLLSYTENYNNTAPVLTFSPDYFSDITLNCANITIGNWKAEMAIPVSENFEFNVPITIHFTPTGSSTAQTIYYTAQFVYKRVTQDNDGENGYSVSFKLPILNNVTTGTLHWISINGSSTYLLPVNQFF